MAPRLTQRPHRQESVSSYERPQEHRCRCDSSAEHPSGLRSALALLPPVMDSRRHHSDCAYLLLARLPQPVAPGPACSRIFIYSVCISLPCILVLPWVSLRYTGRFPRAIVLFQGLSLVLIAAAGSLRRRLCGVPHRTQPSGTAFGANIARSLPFCAVITLAIGLAVSTYETCATSCRRPMLEARTRQMEEERANKLLAAGAALFARIEHPSAFSLQHAQFHRGADPIGSASRRRTGRPAGVAAALQLNAQHSGLVPLAQELKVVRDYLEIEATRYGPRLRYASLVPDSLDSVRIPAMSLQTLVENSVKHVAAARIEGASIQISGGDGRRPRVA